MKHKNHENIVFFWDKNEIVMKIENNKKSWKESDVFIEFSTSYPIFMIILKEYQ